MFLGQRTIRLITHMSANSGYLRRYDQPKLKQKNKKTCSDFSGLNILFFFRQISTWAASTLLRRNLNRPVLTLIDLDQPFGQVWTLNGVPSSKIVGDKLGASCINTSAGIDGYAALAICGLSNHEKWEIAPLGTIPCDAQISSIPAHACIAKAAYSTVPALVLIQDAPNLSPTIFELGTPFKVQTWPIGYCLACPSRFLDYIDMRGRPGPVMVFIGPGLLVLKQDGSNSYVGVYWHVD